MKTYNFYKHKLLLFIETNLFLQEIKNKLLNFNEGLSFKAKSVLVFIFLMLFSFLNINFKNSIKSNKILNTSKTEKQIKERTEGLYEAGVFLVKKYEGLYLMPYYCPAGIPTIGWGHTFDYYKKNGKVYLTKTGKKELLKYQNGISFIEAQQIFKKEYIKNLEKTAKKIGNVKEKTHLLALTSVAYNAGENGMYSKGTAPGKSYKNGESEKSVSEKIKNRFVRKTSFENGIKKRRNEESKLFSSEYDSILQMSKSWKLEVQTEILNVLPKYGLDSKFKNRQIQKPIKKRSSCEMTKNQIKELLKN